jgi:Family of unknown function (DUF5924)/Protein of unknown function (DUF2914)
VGWLRRWGISIASLVGGLLTLFVFQRGLPHVRWIIGYVLLIWLLVAVIVQVRETLEASGKKTHKLVLTATEYTIQSLYHAVLLFLIPAYYAAATLTSVNALFVGLLIVLAVLATFDPLYQAVVHPLPWITGVFFLVSLFGALNLALPLVGVPPFLALLASAWLAVVALTPIVCRARGWRWSRGLVVTSVAGAAVVLIVSAGRVWIPPAPLFLAKASLAWNTGSVDSLEPRGTIPAAELTRRGLVAYTDIYAPAGLLQPVEHVWRQNGQIVNVVPLSPVEGGRREGFRTFSRKMAFGPRPQGTWRIDIMTGSGQLIGRLRFTVVD